MHPWYQGFAGTIESKTGKNDRGSYIVSGTFRRVDDVTVEVTELPVKRWTQVGRAEEGAQDEPYIPTYIHTYLHTKTGLQAILGKHDHRGFRRQVGLYQGL